MAEPIIGGNLAGNVQNQTAVGVSLIGVFINAPVKFFEIFVNGAFDVHHNFVVGAHTIALVAIQDISLGSGKIVGGN